MGLPIIPASYWTWCGKDQHQNRLYGCIWPTIQRLDSNIQYLMLLVGSLKHLDPYCMYSCVLWFHILFSISIPQIRSVFWIFVMLKNLYTMLPRLFWMLSISIKRFKFEYGETSIHYNPLFSSCSCKGTLNKRFQLNIKIITAFN